MSPLFRLLFAPFALVLTLPAFVSAQEMEKPEEPSVTVGEIVWWEDFAPAEAVGVSDVWIWLPDSYYSEKERRYPVLYMHDAENIFDRRLSNFDKEWRVDETITRLVQRGDLREWIVVGLRSPKDRYQALFPQKLLKHLPDYQQEMITRIDWEGIGTAKPLRGDDYAAMVAMDLKSKVDSEIRTLVGPADTAVMGSSMGGLMSVYLIAEYPEVFGQAAGLSTHLPLSDPAGGEPQERAAEVAKAFGAYFAETKLDPTKNRIYVDYGTATLDGYYPPYFEALEAELGRLGWSQPEFESRAFFGAEHEENAWAQRLDIPLIFLDAKDP